MIDGKKITVIIPALNEQNSLPLVLNDIPQYVDTIIVADNGSTDSTQSVAEKAGAQVILEPERGYGAACLRALTLVNNHNTDIIVFLDGDFSDFPDEMTLLLHPILKENVDCVIGSRMTGNMEPGAMLPQAKFGNMLASFLIKLFWGYKFTDLGPFRAITYSAFQQLNMKDRNYGWTVELQIKVAKLKLKCCEVPVSYRKRIGKSKVTGTIKGTVKASYKIMWLIFRELFNRDVPSR